MKINEYIEARRKFLGLTLEQIGDLVGVGKSTVRKWESGEIQNMKRDKIHLLAKALNVSPILLLNDEIEIVNVGMDNVMAVKNRKLPLIGTIAAGSPIYADEQIETYVDVDDNIHADFALRVSGDSMINVRILDGDIVFIRQQPNVEDGEIAAVLIDDSATLKRVFHVDNKIQLMPENPKYKPMYFDENNCDTFKILGKAVAFYSCNV